MEKNNENKVKYDIENANSSNVTITVKSEKGTMQNSIYLWPKEIFKIAPEPSNSNSKE